MTGKCILCGKNTLEICPLCGKQSARQTALTGLLRGSWRTIGAIVLLRIFRRSPSIELCQTPMCGIVFFVRGAGGICDCVCESCDAEMRSADFVRQDNSARPIAAKGDRIHAVTH
jgi:hypothetical protein